MRETRQAIEKKRPIRIKQRQTACQQFLSQPGNTGLTEMVRTKKKIDIFLFTDMPWKKKLNRYAERPPPADQSLNNWSSNADQVKFNCKFCHVPLQQNWAVLFPEFGLERFMPWSQKKRSCGLNTKQQCFSAVCQPQVKHGFGWFNGFETCLARKNYKKKSGFHWTAARNRKPPRSTYKPDATESLVLQLFK